MIIGHISQLIWVLYSTGWLSIFAILGLMEGNTTSLEKLSVSVINLLPSLAVAVVLAQAADWRLTLVASFFVYQVIVALTPSRRSLGMRLLGIRWAQDYSVRSHVIFACLYSLSFSTLVVWVFFPFDLLIANLLLVQLPMVLLTGCTLHGYASGRMYGVRPRN